MAPQSPYETTELFGKQLPNYVPEGAEDDAKRIRAYETYEDMFHNQTDIFLNTMSVDGANERFRRLVPSTRTIIEATNRYLAQGLEWVGMAAPLSEEGVSAPTEESIGLLMAQVQALFDREEFGAKFLSLKRWMLIRGDAMLHVTADQTKDQGKRISIVEINPGSYFAIADPANAERVVGCYIVNIIKDDEGEDIVARLEYQRITTQERASTYSTPIGQVFVRLSFWTLKGWDDRVDDEDMEAASVPSRFGGPEFAPLLTGLPLPAQITSIPVYHFRNNRRGGVLYGTSEVQGIETLINGVNQTITDEELAVALQGLGFYWTDSGAPKDSQGNDADWVVAPGTVAEVEEGRRLGRVDGISNVEASQGHMKALKNEMSETTGTPAIAIGNVDSVTAESGVALSIKMAPIVTKNQEKEQDITSKLVQMMYDLVTGWLPAYEQIQDAGVRVAPAFSNAIPTNREAEVKEIVDLVTAKVISTSFARQLLTERLGYQIPSGEEAALAAEAQATADLLGARMDQEVAAGAGSEPV